MTNKIYKIMENSIKTSILVLSLLVPVILFAQVNPLNSYIDQYKGTPGFYYMDMQTNMFNVDDEEEGSQKSSDETIDFKIISFEKNENATFDPAKIYSDFSKALNKDDYKGLVEVKSSGENVNMMVKKQGKQIAEIIITVQEEDETTIMVASGNFDLKDIAKLSELKSCKGLQALEKLCED